MKLKKFDKIEYYDQKTDNIKIISGYVEKEKWEELYYNSDNFVIISNVDDMDNELILYKCDVICVDGEIIKKSKLESQQSSLERNLTEISN